MDFVDLLRLLPRSALSDLAYSLIPGTVLLFGATWVRWDLATKFLAFPLIDPVSKAVLVALAVLSSGFLLLTVIGGFMAVVFAIVGIVLGLIVKGLVKTEPSYGTSIVWRRLASSLLGENIGVVREAGWPPEKIQESLKAAFDKHLKEQAADQEKLKADLTTAIFGEAANMAADLLKQAETNSEWQAVYRILNEYFEYPQQQHFYFVNALLSTGTVMWTLYHFWLTPVFPLWVAAFLATTYGMFIAITYGFVAAATERTKGLDEKQALRILSILIPRRVNLNRMSE